MALIENQDDNGIYRDWTDDLRISLLFLTRIPWTGRSEISGEPELLPLAPATRFFPVIGMITGAIGALVLMAADWAQLPALAAALLALAAIAIATGGLHEDGLADTADGIGGGVHNHAFDAKPCFFGACKLRVFLHVRHVREAQINETKYTSFGLMTTSFGLMTTSFGLMTLSFE